MSTSLHASFLDVPVDQVRPNPDQPRKFFDQVKLQELANSIAANGLLEVPAVRPDPERDGGYMLIAGERRWRACNLAGLQTMPVRVLHDIGELDAYVLSVAENVNRADMTVMEEAKAYASLIAAGKTMREVCDLFGKEMEKIRWRVELLRLRDDIQEMVEKGLIKPGLAWYLSKLSPAGQQVLAARYCQGRFRNESEAIAVAKEMEAAEAEIPMFEVQEWTPPEKPGPPAAPPVDAASASAAVRKLAATLTTLSVAGIDTEAAGYLDQVDDLAAALDELKAATTAARKLVRKAEARRLLQEAL